MSGFLFAIAPNQTKVTKKNSEQLLLLRLTLFNVEQKETLSAQARPPLLSVALQAKTHYIYWKENVVIIVVIIIIDVVVGGGIFVVVVWNSIFHNVRDKSYMKQQLI